MCGICQEGHDALYKAERNRWIAIAEGTVSEIIAVLKGEAEWRRVKNFIVCLQTGQPIF